MIAAIKAKLNVLEEAFESETAHKILAVLIVLNILILGAGAVSSLGEDTQSILKFIDQSICAVFAIEIGLRLIASGRKFFKNGWNVFDFVVVASSLLATSGITAFRILRVLRIAYIFECSKSTRILVKSIIKSLPGLIHVLGALCIMLYAFTIVAYDLFSKTVPELFGSFSRASYTLIMAVLNVEIAGPIARVSEHHPYGYWFFVIFLVVMSFVMLNLFFGIIVDAIRRAVDEEGEVK